MKNSIRFLNRFAVSAKQLLFLISFLLTVSAAFADVKLASPFNDHMNIRRVRAQADTVFITVNAGKNIGTMQPLWAWFGYDEPNYTYMKDGKKLLTEIAALSRTPVYVRVHSLLTSGDGKPALKWGSTNAYTEDPQGRPVYNWTIIDSIFDVLIARGMKPMAEIGFMPEALSVKPQPYRHHWKPGDKYNDIYTGWAYPPKDYTRWAELVYQWVKHCLTKYGRKEVTSWRWEVWNEPNIGYWKGTREDYFKLYDYAVDAVRRACPGAIVGGPATTGPGGKDANQMLKEFLAHCKNGKNEATGKTGSPLNFISYHAKGSPQVVNGHVRMNMATQLNDVVKGFETVKASSFAALPVIISECDPEGCAACSMQFSPQNAYRNGTMYASYTAASYARLYELATAYKINLEGAVTWAFEFENQPWFDGFRDLATNGVDKPVLNVFRMFGMMKGNRIAVMNPKGITALQIRDSGVHAARPDIGAIASKNTNSICVMAWNYHDDDLPAEAANISLLFTAIPVKKATLQQYRIDAANSNSYEVWTQMGSPQNIDEVQYAELEKSGKLKLLADPEKINIQKETRLLFSLPRQGVSLIRISW
ncbi:MAG: beta-xylosidase [Sediminibacterium sp.]